MANTLKETIGRYSGKFSLVLATDGFQEEASQQLWRKLLFQEATEPGWTGNR
ncbi:MAG: hypothetical protein CM1200mP40_14640 [Gammaproteobacteria bacterium]|nr:MAG: hypothetical protein CM1200mP40_14640 [Gammaproteobacteria bacterium]